MQPSVAEAPTLGRERPQTLPKRGVVRSLAAVADRREANWALDSQKWWSDIAISQHLGVLITSQHAWESCFMGPEPSLATLGAEKMAEEYRAARHEAVTAAGVHGAAMRDGSHDGLGLQL